MYRVQENGVKFQKGTTLTLDDISELASLVINKQAKKERMYGNVPSLVKKIFASVIGYTQEESFWAMYLGTDLRIIEVKKLFSGTVDGCTVVPRSVVKRALENGASAVIFAHNHPSGSTTPSFPDKVCLKRLQNACELFDIRVVDNVIIAADEMVSFAELGLM